ncbi:unnamed protein product [Mytilus edulis]|uniref:SUEL-type lectin domain-containing protein n=1 Tax=Mytilus edulis TaxID=6550 RepID=A0A8S3RRM4_MYTED|nr:unnamed protein product [Mytilus edulis]
MFQLKTYTKSTSTVLQNDITDHSTKSTTTLRDEYESKTSTKVLCQGKILNITCPYIFVVVFDDANFGRRPSDSKRCKAFWGFESRCDNHQNTLAVLHVKCRAVQKCILQVNKSIFGNPCFGRTKYLDVKYHCQQKVKLDPTYFTKKQLSSDHQITSSLRINVTQTTSIYYQHQGRSTSRAFEAIQSRCMQKLYKRKYSHKLPDQKKSPRSTQETEQGMQRGEDRNHKDTNTVKSFPFEKSPQSTQETEQGMQRGENRNHEDFTIIGMLLSGVLLLIFLLIGALLFNRYKKSKQRNGSERTEEIEMNIESENRNQYNYSEVNAQSMGNNENQTVDDGVTNRQNQIENDYDVSSHVPARTESEPLTYDVHVSDNTYNVIETSGNEPKDDVNNTYDHFFGEQTEDQYDTADNKVVNVSQCKTNEDLYY